MNSNCTNSEDSKLSALFIKECRKFISALNSDCSMEELSELRKRIIQLRTKKDIEDGDKSVLP